MLADSSTVAAISLGSPGRRDIPTRADLDLVVGRALKGDRDAWSVLISRFERQVVLSLIAMSVPPAQAREFAHDAWLRLMQQAALGRLEYLQLPGLVIRQALFLARSASRRPDAAVAKGEGEGEGEEGLREVGESTETRYFALERLAKARARLDSLSPSARAVFLSLYSEPQLSHAELATRVGLSVQRVRQIICEVRKELRADLEEETNVRPRHL